MTVHGLEQYRNNINIVDEEDKGLLLLKVFQGTLEKMDLISTYIESKNFEKKFDEIAKLKQIFEILHDSIDPSFGEISKNLKALYIYIIKRLNEINIKNDIPTVSECKSLINTIYEGFEEAYKKERVSECKKTSKDEYSNEIDSLSYTATKYNVVGGVRRGYSTRL